MTTRVIFGRLRVGPGGSAARFEWRYPVDSAELWTALTDPARVERWLAPIVGEQAVGAQVRVVFGPDASAQLTVRACRPGERLAVEWVFPDGLGSLVRVELRPDADGAVLALDQSGFPGSPVDYAAAWQVHLDRLGAELAGRAPADYVSELEELIPHYAAAWQRLLDA
jgi:uncharacterized protein YndB with AHSA1/START domain